MKYIISALLITSGLVFLGLSQRYDYPFQNVNYRLDRLTGQLEVCGIKKEPCKVLTKGTGIFKTRSSGDSD